MPTYDYHCPVCKTTESVVRSVTDDELIPKCNCGELMLRVFGVTGVTFKGSGFYTTDKGK